MEHTQAIKNQITTKSGRIIKIGDIVYPESLVGLYTVVSFGKEINTIGRTFMGSIHHEVYICDENGKVIKYPSNRF